MVTLLLYALGVLAVIAALYKFWRARVEAQLAQGADFEWDFYQRHEPEMLEGYDRAAFDAVYRHANFPRFPGYALAALGTFIFLLPISFGVLSVGISFAAQLGILPQEQELARYVPLGTNDMQSSQKEEMALYLANDFAGFYFFFGIIAIWLIVVAFFMRRYHARRPGYLRDELIRQRPAKS